MLASPAPDDLSTLRFPLLVSPKLDGIRCIMRGGCAISRKLKPIPNRYVQTCLIGLPMGLDGELMVPGGFSAVQSAVMSRDGEPIFNYHVFDWIGPEPEPFEKRYANAFDLFAMVRHPHVRVVKHYSCENVDDVLLMERRFLEQGYEGLMIRAFDGPYKYGRSTVKEGWLLKLKRFHDDEAIVCGAEELHKNQNDLTEDELGYAKRSTHAHGMMAMDTLGALRCQTKAGVSFNIGSGFTEQDRAAIWAAAKAGKLPRLVKYKYQPDPTSEAPRFPTFLGFRDEGDL